MATPARSSLFSPAITDPAWRRRIRRGLLKWFDRHRRDLPWRRSRDAYHIWVSEVMLQQTQAATVVRYFEPFIKSFPTVGALAAADEQDVLRHWQGMGYYRRARNLYQAARMVTEQHHGIVPNDPESLSALPGVGRYMAGAVLSQAYECRLPILEANSRRVLSRLLGQTAPERSLWRAAALLLPRRRVGDFNQAIMELGALVCTSKVPDCAACPLAGACGARHDGTETQIPHRSAGSPDVAVNEVAIVVRRGARVLLAQRPPEGRWPGLWEFPRAEVPAGEAHDAVARRWLHERTGLRIRIGRRLAVIRHRVTNHLITLTCLEANRVSGECHRGHYPRALWLAPVRCGEYPISSPQRRLVQHLTVRASEG